MGTLIDSIPFWFEEHEDVDPLAPDIVILRKTRYSPRLIGCDAQFSCQRMIRVRRHNLP